MKITTKKGDDGKTFLGNGRRVSKNSAIIDLIGEFDELNCFIGACRFVSGIKGGEKICKAIDKIQNYLSVIMAELSDYKCEYEINKFYIHKNNLKFIENLIEEIEKGINLENKFVNPGTSEANSRFHIARAVCRRVERKVAGNKLEKKSGKKEILKYLNRLSDLLFLLAKKYED